MAETVKEIDLAGIVREVWRRKWKVVLYGFLGALVGIVVVIFTATRYTASTVFVAQSDGSSTSISSLSSVAALSGLSGALSSQTSTTLSPRLYPQVITSSAFLKELMYITVNTQKAPAPVTLFEYMNNPAYHSFSLGKLISGLMPRRSDGADSLPAIGTEYKILALSKKEATVATALKGAINIVLDTKDGHIQVSATMPEALVAAQVATAAVNMLQRYITDFKLEKANQKLDFIQSRYNEIKANYYAKLSEISYFRDTHRNQATEVARMQEQKLADEYNIIYALFTDISKQLEQARIDVKKDTPIFTVIDPITIPTRPSAPRRLVTTFLFAVLGGLIAVGGVVLGQMKRED